MAVNRTTIPVTISTSPEYATPFADEIETSTYFVHKTAANMESVMVNQIIRNEFLSNSFEVEEFERKSLFINTSDNSQAPHIILKSKFTSLFVFCL